MFKGDSRFWFEPDNGFYSQGVLVSNNRNSLKFSYLSKTHCYPHFHMFMPFYSVYFSCIQSLAMQKILYVGERPSFNVVNLCRLTNELRDPWFSSLQALNKGCYPKQVTWRYRDRLQRHARVHMAMDYSFQMVHSLNDILVLFFNTELYWINLILV